MGLLTEIIDRKRAELPGLRQRRLPAPPDLLPARLRRTGHQPLSLIAEIKFRSPSAGPLSSRLSVAERAQAYERGGAAMISVLCDQHYFGGGFDRLAEARSACSLPLLCKEFVIDEIQLDAARAFGAAAVLLIVRCLDDASLTRLIASARARELLPIVEVFTEEEAARALGAGADHIGVNARDLDTLEMDEPRAARVLAGLPVGVVRAHFSGIRDVQAIERANASGADAALIGEILMRQEDPEPLLRSFVRATQDRLG